ncbi:MAG TPA: hypothetical protein VFE79_13180 [Paraburkholderia sp.]|jgi:hypothetical protein|nr:hypothetical protein [Paraburkholderia sp.]
MDKQYQVSNVCANASAAMAQKHEGAKKSVSRARSVALRIASVASAACALSFAPMAHAALDGDPTATAFLIAKTTATCSNELGCVYTYKSTTGAWPAIVVLGSNKTVPDDVVATFSYVNGVPSYTALPGQGKASPAATWPAVDCATENMCQITLLR